MTSATEGFCESNCTALAPFVIILIAVIFLVFITRIPFNYFILR